MSEFGRGNPEGGDKPKEGEKRDVGAEIKKSLEFKPEGELDLKEVQEAAELFLSKEERLWGQISELEQQRDAHIDRLRDLGVPIPEGLELVPQKPKGTLESMKTKRPKLETVDQWRAYVTQLKGRKRDLSVIFTVLLRNNMKYNGAVLKAEREGLGELKGEVVTDASAEGPKPLDLKKQGEIPVSPEKPAAGRPEGEIPVSTTEVNDERPKGEIPFSGDSGDKPKGTATVGDGSFNDDLDRTVDLGQELAKVGKSGALGKTKEIPAPNIGPEQADKLKELQTKSRQLAEIESKKIEEINELEAKVKGAVEDIAQNNGTNPVLKEAGSYEVVAREEGKLPENDQYEEWEQYHSALRINIGALNSVLSVLRGNLRTAEQTLDSLKDEQEEEVPASEVSAAPEVRAEETESAEVSFAKFKNGLSKLITKIDAATNEADLWLDDGQLQQIAESWTELEKFSEAGVDGVEDLSNELEQATDGYNKKVAGSETVEEETEEESAETVTPEGQASGEKKKLLSEDFEQDFANMRAKIDPILGKSVSDLTLADFDELAAALGWIDWLPPEDQKVDEIEEFNAEIQDFPNSFGDNADAAQTLLDSALLAKEGQLTRKAIERQEQAAEAIGIGKKVAQEVVEDDQYEQEETGTEEEVVQGLSGEHADFVRSMRAVTDAAGENPVDGKYSVEDIPRVTSVSPAKPTKAGKATGAKKTNDSTATATDDDKAGKTVNREEGEKRQKAELVKVIEQRLRVLEEADNDITLDELAALELQIMQQGRGNERGGLGESLKAAQEKIYKAAKDLHGMDSHQFEVYVEDYAAGTWGDEIETPGEAEEKDDKGEADAPGDFKKEAKKAFEARLERIADDTIEHPVVIETKFGTLAMGTDKGIGYKDINEDALVYHSAEDQLRIMSIDGMGGEGVSGAGMLAAGILAEETAKGYQENKTYAEIADSAYQRMIDELPKSGRSPEKSRGGAVYTGVDIKDGKLMPYQQGDVRVVVYRNGDPVYQTVDQCEEYPARNVVHNAIGPHNDPEAYSGRGTTSEVEPLELEDGDVVVLASDGLWDSFGTPLQNSAENGNEELELRSAEDLGQFIKGKSPEDAINNAWDAVRERLDAHTKVRDEFKDAAKELETARGKVFDAGKGWDDLATDPGYAAAMEKYEKLERALRLLPGKKDNINIAILEYKSAGDTPASGEDKGEAGPDMKGFGDLSLLDGKFDLQDVAAQIEGRKGQLSIEEMIALRNTIKEHRRKLVDSSASRGYKNRKGMRLQDLEASLLEDVEAQYGIKAGGFNSLPDDVIIASARAKEKKEAFDTQPIKNKLDEIRLAISNQISLAACSALRGTIVTLKKQLDDAQVEELELRDEISQLDNRLAQLEVSLEQNPNPALPGAPQETPPVTAASEKSAKEVAKMTPEERLEYKLGRYRIDTSKVEGFAGDNQLSTGQKLLLVQAVEKMMLKEIEPGAQRSFERAQAERGLLGKIAHGFLAGREVRAAAKTRKDMMVSEGAPAEILGGLAAQFAKSKFEVAVNKDGSISVQHGSQELVDSLPDDAGHSLLQLSLSADLLGKIPDEFHRETAKGKEKKKYEEQKKKFETLKERLINETPDDRLPEVMMELSRIDGNVRFQQFVSGNGDLSAELAKIDDDSIFGHGTRSFAKNMALGGAARAALGASIGWFAAPIYAVVRSGYKSRDKAHEQIGQWEEEARLGGFMRVADVARNDHIADLEKRISQGELSESEAAELRNKYNVSLEQGEYVTGFTRAGGVKIEADGSRSESKNRGMAAKLEYVATQFAEKLRQHNEASFADDAERAKSAAELEESYRLLKTRVDYAHDRLESQKIGFSDLRASAAEELALTSAYGQAAGQVLVHKDRFGNVSTSDRRDRLNERYGVLDKVAEVSGARGQYVKDRVKQGVAVALGGVVAGNAIGEVLDRTGVTDSVTAAVKERLAKLSLPSFSWWPSSGGAELSSAALSGELETGLSADNKLDLILDNLKPKEKEQMLVFVGEYMKSEGMSDVSELLSDPTALSLVQDTAVDFSDPLGRARLEAQLEALSGGAPEPSPTATPAGETSGSGGGGGAKGKALEGVQATPVSELPEAASTGSSRFKMEMAVSGDDASDAVVSESGALSEEAIASGKLTGTAEGAAKVEMAAEQHTVKIGGEGSERVGSAWEAGKRMVKDGVITREQFAEAWVNSNVKLPSGETIPLANLGLIHEGDQLTYVPAAEGVAAHFEFVAASDIKPGTDIDLLNAHVASGKSLEEMPEGLVERVEGMPGGADVIEDIKPEAEAEVPAKTGEATAVDLTGVPKFGGGETSPVVKEMLSMYPEPGTESAAGSVAESAITEAAEQAEPPQEKPVYTSAEYAESSKVTELRRSLNENPPRGWDKSDIQTFFGNAEFTETADGLKANRTLYIDGDKDHSWLDKEGSISARRVVLRGIKDLANVPNIDPSSVNILSIDTLPGGAKVNLPDGLDNLESLVVHSESNRVKVNLPSTLKTIDNLIVHMPDGRDLDTGGLGQVRNLELNGVKDPDLGNIDRVDNLTLKYESFKDIGTIKHDGSGATVNHVEIKGSIESEFARDSSKWEKLLEKSEIKLGQSTE